MAKRIDSLFPGVGIDPALLWSLQMVRLITEQSGGQMVNAVFDVLISEV